jgi:hypothetical protein
LLLATGEVCIAGIAAPPSRQAAAASRR